MVRKYLTKEELERKYFISQILVGECPACGSDNTHDCSKSEYVPSDPRIKKGIMSVGSDCPVAQKLDDLSIGHCDDCNHIWCLECGSRLSIDEPLCEHWAVCGICWHERGYLTLDEIMEKVCAKCEYWKDGCRLENPSECEKTKPYECPYEADISECPKIKSLEK